MKEMKRQLYLRRDDLLLTLSVSAGGFLFGILLSWIIGYVDGSNETAMLGTLMSLVLPYVLMMFVGGIVYASNFNLSIGMGGVRRQFIPSFLLITYAECLCVFIFAFLLHEVETMLYRIFWKNIVAEDILAEQIPYRWAIILLLPFFIVAVQSLFGALFIRFGKVIFWVLWCLWMVICFSGTWFEKLMQNAWFRQLTVNMTMERILLAAVAILAAATMAGYLLLRKQQVRLE